MRPTDSQLATIRDLVVRWSASCTFAGPDGRFYATGLWGARTN